MLILFTPELNWELGGKVSCHCQQGAECGICQSLLKLSFTYDMHMAIYHIRVIEITAMCGEILSRQCCHTNIAIQASLVGTSCRDWFENSTNVFENVQSEKLFQLVGFCICSYKLCRDSHMIATFYARIRNCSICAIVLVCVRVTYHTYLARFLCSVWLTFLAYAGDRNAQQWQGRWGQPGAGGGALPAAVTDM